MRRGENRLRPTRKVSQIIGYLLAVLSKERGVELNAVCYLGNHEHGVANDPNSEISNLMQDLHSLISKHIKASFDEDEILWNSKPTNLVLLGEPEDTLIKMAYVMANPVHHRLVKFAKNYPGLRMAWPARPRAFKRPTGFLDAESTKKDGTPRWPKVAVLEMHRPRGFDHLSDNELAIKVGEIMRVEEDRYREEVVSGGGSFLGKGELLKQSRDYRPLRKPKGDRLIPKVACKNAEKRSALLEALSNWLGRYAAALERFRAGERDVVFPYGTFKMRVQYGVNVEPAPT